MIPLWVVLLTLLLLTPIGLAIGACLGERAADWLDRRERRNRRRA